METVILTSARRNEVGLCSVTEGWTWLWSETGRRTRVPLGPAVPEDGSERHRRRAVVPIVPTGREPQAHGQRAAVLTGRELRCPWGESRGAHSTHRERAAVPTGREPWCPQCPWGESCGVHSAHRERATVPIVPTGRELRCSGQRTTVPMGRELRCPWGESHGAKGREPQCP